MANKKTLKDYYYDIIALATENGRDDLVKFCEDRIEKLGHKSTSKKLTKTQVENEGIKDIILDVLAEIAPATATMVATDPRVNVSNQKVTALLTQLIKDDKVVKTVEKGKSYFSVADEATEE